MKFMLPLCFSPDLFEELFYVLWFDESELLLSICSSRDVVQIRVEIPLVFVFLFFDIII